jgi:ABC-type Fe3+ transport system permease subunit
LPTILGLYGVDRVRRFGIDDPISWVMLPILGFVIAACALTAIVYGLMGMEQWNTKFNPTSQADTAAGQTNWLTIAAVVLSLLIGCTAFIFGIVQVIQHYFEYQLMQG